MKKKYVVLLIAPILFVSLTGCDENKDILTYGTHIQTSLEKLETISEFDLFWRVTTFKETFILATYQSEYECLCWETFQNVIVNYTNTYHEKVYLFDTSNQDSAIEQFKLNKYKDSTNALYIFKCNKQIAQFSFKKDTDKTIFTDLSGKTMFNRIHRYVEKPVIYEVDEAYLENKIKEKEESITLFIREGCSDCRYALTDILIPYINTHKTKKEIWYYDLQNSYELANKEDATDLEKAQYQEIKDKYELSASTNSVYGYLNGVVPTIQYREKGILKDAAVCFNDVVDEKDDGSFYLSDSYYSEERIPFLKYYSGNPLKGMTIEGGLKTVSGYKYWNQTDAIKAHRPIFEAFLNYYL